MNGIVKPIFIVYLAVVSLIGLVMSITSTTQLANAGLKTWVFPIIDVPAYVEDCDSPNAYVHSEVPIYMEDGFLPGKASADSGEELSDEELKVRCEARVESVLSEYRIRKAQDSVRSISVLIVGIPLFIFHYRLFKSEYFGRRKDKNKNSK